MVPGASAVTSLDQVNQLTGTSLVGRTDTHEHLRISGKEEVVADGGILHFVDMRVIQIDVPVGPNRLFQLVSELQRTLDTVARGWQHDGNHQVPVPRWKVFDLWFEQVAQEKRDTDKQHDSDQPIENAPLEKPIHADDSLHKHPSERVEWSEEPAAEESPVVGAPHVPPASGCL